MANTTLSTCGTSVPHTIIGALAVQAGWQIEGGVQKLRKSNQEAIEQSKHACIHKHTNIRTNTRTITRTSTTHMQINICLKINTEDRSKASPASQQMQSRCWRGSRGVDVWSDIVDRWVIDAIAPGRPVAPPLLFFFFFFFFFFLIFKTKKPFAF